MCFQCDMPLGAKRFRAEPANSIETGIVCLLIRLRGQAARADLPYLNGATASGPAMRPNTKARSM